MSFKISQVVAAMVLVATTPLAGAEKMWWVSVASTYRDELVSAEKKTKDWTIAGQGILIQSDNKSALEETIMLGDGDRIKDWPARPTDILTQARVNPRWYVATTSHLSQGNHLSIKIGGEIPVTVRHRISRNIFDLEIFEIDPPTDPRAVPFAYAMVEGIFVDPQIAEQLGLQNEKNINRSLRGPHLVVDFNSAVILPPKFENLISTPLWQQIQTQRLMIPRDMPATKLQTEVKSSLHVVPGMSGSPIIRRYRRKEEYRRYELVGLVSRTLRDFESSYFAHRDYLRMLLAAYVFGDRTEPPHYGLEEWDSTYWSVRGGLMFRRHLLDKNQKSVEEWRLAQKKSPFDYPFDHFVDSEIVSSDDASKTENLSQAINRLTIDQVTGDFTSSEGGNGTSSDGGNGTSSDGGNGTSSDGGNGTSSDGGGTTTPAAGVQKDVWSAFAIKPGMVWHDQNVEALKLEMSDSVKGDKSFWAYASFQLIPWVQFTDNMYGLKVIDSKKAGDILHLLIPQKLGRSEKESFVIKGWHKADLEIDMDSDSIKLGDHWQTEHSGDLSWTDKEVSFKIYDFIKKQFLLFKLDPYGRCSSIYCVTKSDDFLPIITVRSTPDHIDYRVDLRQLYFFEPTTWGDPISSLESDSFSLKTDPPTKDDIQTLWVLAHSLELQIQAVGDWNGHSTQRIEFTEKMPAPFP